MIRKFAGILAFIWFAWPAPADAQSPARGLRAERFDVALTLLDDGSVNVRETVVFHFTEKTFSRVEREVPLRRFDGVIDVRASLDGRVLAEDDSSERIQIREGRSKLEVTWHFPEVTNTSRTFTLEYRAMGALAVANRRATLEWFVLPSRHRYVIDEARVEWRVPPTAVRVEQTAIDDARWTSTALSDGWAATRRDVGVDETARLTDAFDLSTLAVAVPEWQVNAFRARQMAPAFIVCAVILLVCAAGVLGMTWVRYRLPSNERRGTEPAAAHHLPPAAAAAIVSGPVTIGLQHVQATLFDLARRGVLQIRESTDSKSFEIVRPTSPRRERVADLKPHEQVVVDGLWLVMKDGRVDLKRGWREVTRKLRAFQRSLREELLEAGLVDPERRWAARAMVVAGIVTSAIGIVGFAVFQLAFGHLGGVPLLVPASVLVSGLAFLIWSSVMSVRSAAGVAAAEAWKARRAWLKSAVKAPMSAADIATWFPTAAGFGLAHPMIKMNKGALTHEAAAFAWLGPVREPGAALAIIVATTSPASHHGGSSGGGASGGGSSSAS